MCRSRITSDNTGRTKSSLWKDRLKEMRSNKQLGFDVAWHLQNLVDKKVKEVLKENKKLRDENYRLQMIKDCMESLGISSNELRFGRQGIERRLKELMSGIPFDLLLFLEHIEHNAKEALKVLKQNKKVEGSD